jgi:hypothetical protein
MLVPGPLPQNMGKGNGNCWTSFGS